MNWCIGQWSCTMQCHTCMALFCRPQQLQVTLCVMQGFCLHPNKAYGHKNSDTILEEVNQLTVLNLKVWTDINRWVTSTHTFYINGMGQDTLAHTPTKLNRAKEGCNSEQTTRCKMSFMCKSLELCCGCLESSWDTALTCSKQCAGSSSTRTHGIQGLLQHG